MRPLGSPLLAAAPAPSLRRGASPWSVRRRIATLGWECCWLAFCAWTPKPLWRWRNLWLRLYGARIGRRVFVHQRARIAIPWNVALGDGACVGDRANLYSLGSIAIGRGATIAQEAYLCAGSHDFGDPALSLVTGSIVVESGAFVGARAFILPGLVLGAHSIIGAASVVTQSVPANGIVAGNPARLLRYHPSGLESGARA
jgi:putative colanic acid biosynthesis acetyltransferase WcaF